MLISGMSCFALAVVVRSLRLLTILWLVGIECGTALAAKKAAKDRAYKHDANKENGYDDKK